MEVPIMKNTEDDKKYDAGKLLADILFSDFPDALKEVMAVATYGAYKYERASWKKVKDAEVRYADAKARHYLASKKEDFDDESRLYHLAHEAWCALALLQLKMEQKGVDTRDYDWVIQKALKAKQEALKNVST